MPYQDCHYFHDAGTISFYLFPFRRQIQLMRYFILLSVLPLIASCQSKKTDYAAFKDCQDYSVPLWSKSDSVTRPVALFVFPHPDDEVVCGGAIATLKNAGWEINLLTMTRGVPGQETTRQTEWENAVRVFGFDHHHLLDLPNNTWDAVKENKLIFWNEHTDSVKKIIYQAIQQYRPSLVFTYDDVIGGYGHPEHRLTASLTKELLQEYKADSSFTPQTIYQITLTDKLEQKTLGSLESYKKGLEASASMTLPAPAIAFDIKNVWPVKREAAMAYTSQLKTLRKFFLIPAAEDTAIHYASFDREYYHVIKR